ncbi:unnamed protein product [Rhizophagus irregularis]|nr:unnamed protein product [Rhizophagus irregularis]
MNWKYYFFTSVANTPVTILQVRGTIFYILCRDEYRQKFCKYGWDILFRKSSVEKAGNLVPTPQSDFRSASTIDSSTSSQTIQEEKQKRKRIQLLSKDINSTRERLLALPQLEEHGEYTGSCEIILKENVSLEEYLDYRDKNPSFPVRIYLHDGKIKAYEIPLAPHSMVSAVIKGLMFSWNHQELEYGYMIVGQNSAKEPDSWVRPEGRPQQITFKAMD